MAITPDGTRAYVTSQSSGNVSVIDTTTNMELAPPILIGLGPSFGLAITPDGKHVYVTNINDNNVSVIDTTTNTVATPPISMGLSPSGVAITPLPNTPTIKDQCQKDGWKTYSNPTFKNQGQCVSFVEHLK